MVSNLSTFQDWSKNEEFFKYTAGRFLFNESHEISRRSVRFNMNELVSIAARSVGSASCRNVQKLSEGQYNKVFLLQMDDGTETIAKVPNPNAGDPILTTASEVATMDFVRDILRIPAPKGYAWSSIKEGNPVGAEYIIMEKARGVPLSTRWDALSNEHKESLIEQMIVFEKAFISTKFRGFGSLYYKHSLENVTGLSGSPLLELDEDLHKAGRFVIGPTTDRKCVEDDRTSVDFSRGPWNDVQTYIVGIAEREMACVRKIHALPRPLGFFTGSYRPTREAKLSVLEDFLNLAHYLIPPDQTVLSSVLWHSDLRKNNIFVNPQNPGEITDIIDWQSVHLEPAFLHVRAPSLLEFEGPQWEQSDIPQLPEGYENMNAIEKSQARKLRDKQTLYKLYEFQALVQNNEAYKAMQYKDTLATQIITLTSNILQDGEPLIRGLLMRFVRKWASTPAGKNGKSCPLSYSEQEEENQQVEEEEWLQGLHLMKQVLNALGEAETRWQGWVSHQDYDLLRKRLDDVRRQYLSQAPDDDYGRRRWEEAWPFKD